MKIKEISPPVNRVFSVELDRDQLVVLSHVLAVADFKQVIDHVSEYHVMGDISDIIYKMYSDVNRFVSKEKL